MTNLEKILQKKYKDKLLKLSIYKKKLAKEQELLKEYGISCNPKDDISYFQCEVLYESVYNKKRLEDSFMESYVEMQDFWDDLDYKERNHLVHVDIGRRCGDLKNFEYQGQTIYIPILDGKINHMYADEIVNLELKQYRTLTKDFSAHICNGVYGSYPYQHRFSSAEWIAEDDRGYCLYFSRLNRFYYVVNETCESILSLDPERRDVLDDEQKTLLAIAFMKNDEKTLSELILKYQCVDEKIQKKIQRNLQKMNS